MTANRLSNLIACGIASGADLKGAAYDDVVRAKRQPQLRMAAEDSSALDGRRIRYVWSTESVDRMGDIIRQNWDLGPFTRNPVSLFNHNHDQVIGKAVDFGVEMGSEPRLVGTIQFAPEGTDPLIDSRYKLAAAGMLRATSVGFLPTEITEVRDGEERSRLGLGQWGVVFEQSQLLEISVVSVPANPDATQTGLSEYVERGVISADEAEMVARDTPLTERDWMGRLERLATAGPPAAPVAPVEADLVTREHFDASMADIRAQLKALTKHTHTQGDPDRGEAKAQPVESSRGWDIAEVLDKFTEEVDRRLGRDGSQTMEVP